MALTSSFPPAASLLLLLAALLMATPARCADGPARALDAAPDAAAPDAATAEDDTNDGPEELDWWQTAVIYQIYPRSFKDSNGDGVGDLNGIREKAQYLKDLGVGAVWLSPIYKSPMVDFGYDIADFTDVDPTFGTLDDFDALRNTLKDLGIKLLMDFVPNHSSDHHPWFAKSARREEPYTDYYVWADGTPDSSAPNGLRPPNNWLSVFGGPAWQWHEGRKQFYLHQFAIGQPDLNYRNPRVVKDMEAVLEFWLSRGVDGFRVDAVPFLVEDARLRDEEPSGAAGALPTEHASLLHTRTQNHPGAYSLVRAWRRLLDAYSQQDGQTRLMMVEAYAQTAPLMRYFGNSSAPGAHFPFNFALLGVDSTSKASDVKSAVQGWMDNMPQGGWPNWVIGNHDTRRVATRSGRGLVDAMNMLTLLLPGTAVTYNGEELGMEDALLKWEETVDPQGRNAGSGRFHLFSRDPARTPFQWDGSANAGFSLARRTWLPLNPNFRSLNAAAQARSPSSHLQVYRRLVRLRATPAAQRGALNLQAPSDSLLAFARELPGSESLFVVINMADTNTTADLQSALGELPESLAVLVPSVSSGYREGQRVVSKEIELPPKASLVLSSISCPEGDECRARKSGTNSRNKNVPAKQ